MEPGLVDEIRHATNGNYALGNEGFAAQVAVAFGRRAVPGKSGRPYQIDSGAEMSEENCLMSKINRGLNGTHTGTGMKREAVSRALSSRGNPTLKTLATVCRAIGVRLDAHIA